jgi:hypothetical protein
MIESRSKTSTWICKSDPCFNNPFAKVNPLNPPPIINILNVILIDSREAGYGMMNRGLSVIAMWEIWEREVRTRLADPTF